MKTEPTKALKLLSETQLTPIHEIPRYKADIIARIAFSEGQSSPKIKQLEWLEVNGLGETVIKAKTSFGDYDIYERSAHGGYIIWCFGQNPHRFDTEIQAKMYAQADFEKMVKECLDYD